MYAKEIILVLLAASASATPQYADTGHYFRPPGAGDRRSPCPMVNSLANHGFLPHSGFNVSMEDLVAGFREGINLAEDATRLVGARALLASSTGNNNTFHLDDLNKHGIIEHDGSLSRGDTAQGDNHSFNATIWATVTRHFTKEKISIATAAAARKARLAAAEAENPSFNISASGIQGSLLETAIYLRVFGNGTEGDAEREWVKVLFEKERLPYRGGFTRSTNAITTQELFTLVGKISAAST